MTVTGTSKHSGAHQDLDRRRRKLQQTQDASAKAAATLDQIEAQIGASAQQRRELKARLAEAVDQVAAAKNALKASSKEAARLEAARKAAGRRAAAAQQRVARAESKYDDAMWADLLRREKANDLSVHDPGPKANGGNNPRTSATRSASDHVSHRDDRAAERNVDAENAAEPDTARETAARLTAARADAPAAPGVHAPQSQEHDGETLERNTAGSRSTEP